MSEHTVARGLGLASLGIGLTEIAMPRQIERVMGVGRGQGTGVLRTLGVREVMHGVDLLTNRDPTPGVMARVAGDVLDLAALGAAAPRTRRPVGFAAVALMVLAIGVLDVWVARRLTRTGRSVSQATSWFRRSRGRTGRRALT